jgi:hypothetical protein
MDAAAHDLKAWASPDKISALPADLLLSGLVDRPGHQAAPPSAAARCLCHAGGREPADLAHRRQWVSRRLGSAVRVRSACGSRHAGEQPPIPLRHLADKRRYVSADLLPRLRPREARPQCSHQGSARFRQPAQPLPWQKQPSVHLSSQAYDRQAAALLVRRLASRAAKVIVLDATLGSAQDEHG